MDKIVAFTGAGISRSAGLPTFAEMGGLRDKLSRSYFHDQPEDFYAILRQLDLAADQAKPTKAHLALARYGVEVVTMNIDGLHQKAGSLGVIEVHGHLRSVFCPSCRQQYPFAQVYSSICCPDCRAILEPELVLYGDNIRYYFAAIDCLGSASQVLVVGTSDYTSTVKDLIGRVRMAGIPVTEINRSAEKEVPKFLAKHCRV